MSQHALFPCAATKYEARLLEEKGGPLTEERTILVFDVFDKILPHLGVFQKVMQMCRDELFSQFHFHFPLHNSAEQLINLTVPITSLILKFHVIACNINHHNI